MRILSVLFISAVAVGTSAASPSPSAAQEANLPHTGAGKMIKITTNIYLVRGDHGEWSASGTIMKRQPQANGRNQSVDDSSSSFAKALSEHGQVEQLYSQDVITLDGVTAENSTGQYKSTVTPHLAGTAGDVVLSVDHETRQQGMMGDTIPSFRIVDTAVLKPGTLYMINGGEDRTSRQRIVITEEAQVL
ncbi:hypothetical protein ACMAUO_20515 [Gluconacetobacter sp. Hr-1-5]|uniref:hypothetical protein n=1 Tax=Gluconacetobacter sp. Hr-1-5 TaxID=3395370 RepID=UPI003B5290E6